MGERKSNGEEGVRETHSVRCSEKYVFLVNSEVDELR